MKSVIQPQSPASILRAEIEAWRTAGRMSREAVAIAVVEAHEASGADASTEIRFDFNGSDAYDRAKKVAQKIFRWLDEGNLPANMVPSILAVLPMERRLACLGQMYCQLGVEVRPADRGADASLDVSAHLRSVIKEAGEAQLALAHLTDDASDEELLAAHKELVEGAQACESAARDAMAKVLARQTMARAAASASK